MSLKYENLKEDAKLLWGIAKAMISDGLSVSEIIRITETVTLGVSALVELMEETPAAEKKALALQLVDDFYRTEIEPRDLLPWPAAEEVQDQITGPLVHKTASWALDKLLGIE